MIDRTKKPLSTNDINFHLPQINIHKLNNGLRIFHIEKTTLPIVQMNLIISAGSIYDPITKNGTSLLTSMLIDEGAGELTGLEISDKIESLGSIMNISSSKEFTTISLLSLKENLENSLNILSKIINSPNFNEDDFQRESNKLKSQVLQLNDDPSYIASTIFNNYIYSNTPYQFPSHGSTKSLIKIDNIAIKNFYKENYSIKDISLIIVGNITKEESWDIGNKYFDYKSSINDPKNLNFTFSKQSKKIILVNKKDAAQSEIRIGHLSKGRKSDDFYARTILNSIIGGQFSSRLNLNLREDKGYTYGVNSNYNYNKFGSSFVVSTSVKTENTSEALREIYLELEKAIESISVDEVEFSKSYLVKRFPSLFETYSQLASNLSLIPIFELNENYFNNYISNISSTGIVDVQNTARNNILLDQLITVVVGNKELIEKDLRVLAKTIDAEFILENYKT